MKYTTFYALTLLTILAVSFVPLDFFDTQLTYPRVRKAYADKGDYVQNLLSQNGVSTSDYDLFIRGFKTEQSLEVWARNKGQGTYKLIKTYPFCATTGVLGPKRKSGDKQIPEGFYNVNFFNPESTYHLSFRINYPNKSDLVFADKLNPGDNIFIHGDCVTIGCIPVGDDNIDELYLLAAKAQSGGGALDVHLFPNKMTDANYAALQSQYAGNKKLLEFWAWLKPGYDAFEKTQTVPKVIIADDGSYMIR